MKITLYYFSKDTSTGIEVSLHTTQSAQWDAMRAAIDPKSYPEIRSEADATAWDDFDSRDGLWEQFTETEGFQNMCYYSHGDYEVEIPVSDREVKMETALREILSGSKPRGRWINQLTMECPDGDHHNPDAEFPGCVFEYYNEEEQVSWLETVVDTCETALGNSPG